MTVRKYSSRAQQTTLSAAITSTATSMTVVNGSALMGGKTLTGSETYTVVIDPDTSLEEIVDVTLYSSGNTLTITRGIDGSGPSAGTGVAHSAGAVVRHMVVGRDLQEANTHSENTTTAHGLTLANVVLTTGTGNVSTTMLDSGSVTTAKIADANVTTAKIADSAVTSAKIADLTIATGDIADSAITSGKIATGAVGTTKIDDLSITTGKIVDSAVTTAKIADSNVTTGKIADSAITSAKIANGTIVDADISSTAAIDKTKISGTAITAGDTGTVTSTMIADGTIVNADISASAGVAYSKLSLNSSITSADIVDGTIVNADINASANIALSKLATDPLARANHTGTQAASTISDFDTQVRTNKVTDLAAPTGSFSMNSQKITNLATPTDSGDASTKGYIDTQITNLINGAPGTLDTLKEIADQIQAGGTFYDSVVFKSGSTMTGALVLNADPSTNLGAATKQYVDAVAGSATAAAASATAAAASYDSFDDRYLGSKSSAPTLDNDGNALITGALYWNSVDGAMYAWTGSEWGSISSTAEIYRYKFVASGGETSVSGTDANGLTLSYLAGKEQVYLNGVLLVRGSDYTASNGTSITSLAALAASDVLEVITFTAFDLATAISKDLFDAKGDILVATAADTPGKLALGTNGYYLKVNTSTATGLEWVQIDLSTYATLTGSETLTNKTLTSPIISTISNTGTLTLPTSTDTLVGRATTDTLTNKTLTSPVINTATVTGGSIADAVIKGIEEDVNVVASAATGTINFDVSTASVWYYTSNATANHTLNFRYSSGTSLNSAMAVGDAITLVWLNTNGSTAYYPNVIQIDGTTVTPKVPAAISAGNASAIDAYSFTIIKTASATFTVLETQTKFA